MRSIHKSDISTQQNISSPKPKNRMRIRWTHLLWVLSPLLLWWALHNIKLAEVWFELSQIGLKQIAIIAGINSGIILLTGARWWIILRAQGYRIRYSQVTGYRVVSFGVSYFTPGPQFGGEPVQVYYLNNRHGIPVSSAIASVSLDKIFELLANLLFLIIGVNFTLQTKSYFQISNIQVIISLTLPFMLLIGYSIAIWIGIHPLSILLGLVPSKLQSYAVIKSIVTSTEAQMSEFCQRKPASVLIASLISAAIWIAMVAEYWVMVNYLGLKLNPAETIIALTASRLAFLFPLPGGLGVLEAGQVAIMNLLANHPTIGISISIVMRARDLLIGLVSLFIGLVLRRQKIAPSTMGISKNLST